MLKPDKYIDQHPDRIFVLLLLLAIPAFLINLGLLPLFADEPTRANVALEMILSGNFSVPTVGGEYYYNKPPLYNWILAGVYQLFGGYSEFLTRLPAFVPLFLFAFTIYWSGKRFLNDSRIGALAGLLMLVNGRVLIYDSMLGHIDLFYSWLTFISFMLIFHCYQKKQWFLLFFLSYLITAVTFLCKGLPSIVFQGCTILALLIYTRNFKTFLSWQHIVSGIICLLIIGSYFYNYYHYNPDLKGYFSTIWDQSSRRTAAEYSIGHTLLYLITFPFEHLGHLFPASLFIVFCFNRRFIGALKSNPFLKFITIIFLANIWVYWLSPQTRPRYILMLYPLLFILWSYAYFTFRAQYPALNRFFNRLLLIIGVLVTCAIPAVWYFDLNEYVPYFNIKAASLLLLAFGCTAMMYYLGASRAFAFILLLLVVRLGFSWFVLPHRLVHMEESYFRKSAIEMGQISGKEPFFFYQYHPAEPLIPFHDRLIFYIQRTKMQKVKFTESVTKPGYYLTFDRELIHPGAQLIRDYRSLKLYQIK